LAEPLGLEVGVAGEVSRGDGRGAALLEHPLAFGELLVEIGPEPGVEELTVRGRVRAGVAVGRDDEVVRHGQPPGSPRCGQLATASTTGRFRAAVRAAPPGRAQTLAGACSRNAMLAAPSGTTSRPAITSSTRGPKRSARGAHSARAQPETG